MKTFGKEFVREIGRRFPKANITFSNHLSLSGRMHGYRITFPNGFVASIQFSRGSYCSNRTLDAEELFTDIDPEESHDAEIAGWWLQQENDEFIPFDNGDDVLGWQTVENVLAWLEEYAKKRY